jgi:hypothetical protein
MVNKRRNITVFPETSLKVKMPEHAAWGYHMNMEGENACWWLRACLVHKVASTLRWLHHYPQEYSRSGLDTN